MRRTITLVSAVIVIASAVLLTGGRLSLQAPAAAAQTSDQQQIGSWLLTLTELSGSQTTPVLLTVTTDGTLVAGELPIASAPLLPGPSEAPASPGESAPAATEPPPAPSEAPAGTNPLFNSPGQGVWTASGPTQLVFTYVVLQSDQAGNFVAKVTVSGTAAIDDTGNTMSGDYTMRFAGPDGQDLGSSSGTLEGDRIELALFARFDATQVAGSLDVAFKDNSTGDPTDWTWDFGDGSLVAGQNPTHTYAQPGDYQVTLTVSNDQGSDTKTQTVTVNQVSTPTADFSTAQTPGSLEVKFTDASTGGPNAWTWDFGDGSSSTKQNPKHTYAKVGDYKVKLTASNAGGSDSKTETVTVAKPPTADFSITQTAGSLEVKFSDASKGTPTAWNWDFGDGSSSTKPNPRHTYAKAGDYDVTLTATNGAGSDKSTETVTVPPAETSSPSPSASGGG